MRLTDQEFDEAFWKLVIKTPECWLWTGNWAGKGGYGNFKGRAVHRYAYSTRFGEIPKGMDVHHKCKHKICVNPDHLEAVPRDAHPDNITFILSQKQFCPKGHPYDNSNTYLHGGARHCKACCKVTMHNYYLKRTQAG